MIKPQIVNKLKSINELTLLQFLATKESWSNRQADRTLLSEYLNVSEITIKKCLKSLLEQGFIEKISKGVYKINKEVIQ